MTKTTIERQTLIEALHTLPDEALTELASFVAYLRYKTLSPSPSEPTNPNFLLTIAGLGESSQTHIFDSTREIIPPGTLTGLRGIAKRPEATDADLQAEYIDYLTQENC
jgi:hypothetical protein